MTYEDITLDIEESVATVTFNAPKSLNALRIKTVEELIDAFDQIHMTPNLRVVVLTGSGRGFSSGGDLQQMMHAVGDSQKLTAYAEKFALRLGDLSRRIRQISLPVIAKINGPAAGAGMSLALACDFRIASTKSKFVQSFVKVGLVPDAGGIGYLTKLVGASKATEWVMLGDEISAEEAYQAGLLYRLVPPEELDGAVDKLVERLASSAPLALRKVKETINTVAFSDMEAVYASEVVNQAYLAHTADFMEGVSAFVEKRKPTFKGK